MSMHLVGPYMTTTNYKKKKQKPRTKAQQAKFEQEHRDYNKRMKRMNCHDQMMSLEDYDLYVRGQYKPKSNAVAPKSLIQSNSYRRETPHIPSAGAPIGNAPKQESNVYSGERQLLGIATMHKSNMVPIFADNKEQAKEIAQMRRN